MDCCLVDEFPLIYSVGCLYSVHSSISTIFFFMLYCSIFTFHIGALALKVKVSFHSTQNRKHTSSLHPTHSGPDIPPSPVVAFCYSCSSALHIHTYLPSFQLHYGRVYQQRPQSRFSPKGSQSNPPNGEPFLQA